MKTIRSAQRLFQRRLRGERVSVRELARDERGAIDLASILIGVLILGIAAGIVWASVSWLPSFTQDQAAKADAGAIVTAQEMYYAREGFDRAQRYAGSIEQLQRDMGHGEGGYLAADINSGPVDARIRDGYAMPSGEDRIQIGTSGNGPSSSFIVCVMSATGKVYSATNTETTPVDDLEVESGRRCGGGGDDITWNTASHNP
ncbi:hypothetical protein [Nesterenkonia rhizosphaerae]|uniref:Type IV pilus assembly protein PilA n=1 Tax=Nesterenkonia rhizosphaerae TaxID=1348272 RepID=A0ABP9G027_9MICC